MPRSTKLNTQWKNCDRCGILTPMERLTLDKGFLICDRHGCWDGPDPEARDRLLGKIMSQPTEENTDRRSQLYFRQEDWDDYR